MNNDLAIVMYHYVRDFSKTDYPKINGLDVRLFENQIKYFSKHYNIISMEDLLHCHATNMKIPAKSVMLTFDDGYSDHYDYALPILKKYKTTGCFYVPSGPIENNEVLGVNKIHFLMSVLDEEFMVKEIFKFIDQYRKEYSLKSNEEYYQFYKDKGYHLDSPSARYVKKMLQLGLPFTLRKLVVDQLFRKYFQETEEEFSLKLYLSKKKISEMLSEGMHIGSHAHSHQWLASLSYEEQIIELEKSLSFLDSCGVDRNTYTIGYPFGSYNEDTLQVAKMLGIKAGVTTKNSVANISSENILALSRIDTNDFPKDTNTQSDKWLNN